jgi:cobalt-zinc-cadmium efflux system outer membrane protein
MRAARNPSDSRRTRSWSGTASPCTYRVLIVTIGLATGLSGCVLAPHGTRDEQSKLNTASPPFESRIEARQIPQLPAVATWQDVLSRAFLANGELESSYFEWKAAFTRIDQVATWPNSNVALSFGYLFSPGNMKAWDRTTIGAGFDPSMNLSLPVKTRTAGKVALDAAREAGDRFRAVKFDLQRRVLVAYLDLALTEELIRIERDNLTFLKLLSDSASDRAEAGGPMQDLFKALIESETAQNDLAGLEAKSNSMRGELNGMLGREPSAPLGLPPALPPPRPVTADDAALIAVAVSQNPELAALAQQVAGRSDAVELARLAYLPDIIPSASITGSVSQSLGAMLMVPTKLPAIRAAIDEAAAMTRSAEAMLRQTQRDRAARFVADLYLMRNAEREGELYRARVVPAARQLVSSSRNAYAAGTIVFADLIDSERMFISVRRMVAEAQIEREQRLAELEALAGIDIETLGRQANIDTAPAADTARAE